MIGIFPKKNCKMFTKVHKICRRVKNNITIENLKYYLSWNHQLGT